MDTTQQVINNILSVKKKAHKWFSDKSTDLLHEHLYDRPSHFDVQRFFIIDSMEYMLCASMDCDFDLNSDVLERMKLYIEKRQ